MKHETSEYLFPRPLGARYLRWLLLLPGIYLAVTWSYSLTLTSHDVVFPPTDWRLFFDYFPDSGLFILLPFSIFASFVSIAYVAGILQYWVVTGGKGRGVIINLLFLLIFIVLYAMVGIAWFYYFQLRGNPKPPPPLIVFNIHACAFYIAGFSWLFVWLLPGWRWFFLRRLRNKGNKRTPRGEFGGQGSSGRSSDGSGDTHNRQ